MGAMYANEGRRQLGFQLVQAAAVQPFAAIGEIEFHIVAGRVAMGDLADRHQFDLSRVDDPDFLRLRRWLAPRLGLVERGLELLRTTRQGRLRVEQAKFLAAGDVAGSEAKFGKV